MKVICKNSSYDAITMLAFINNNIRYPEVDEECYVTRIHNYVMQGKVGFFLEGYEGQFIADSKSRNTNELSFNQDRFVKADRTQINKEDIKELKKIKQLV